MTRRPPSEVPSEPEQSRDTPVRTLPPATSDGAPAPLTSRHSSGSALGYVLITPARNEERFIENTIRSVIAQTALPLRWVIVSDGSTDATEEIVSRHLPSHPWMKLVRLPGVRKRDFAEKVHTFNAGFATIKDTPFDVVGNLDADISFDADYFSFLLERFAEDSRLGVAGTPFTEDNYSSSRDSFEGERHVAGGCQLFRRGCFEEIGGYIPNPAGGIDWIAVTTARMRGWTTRSFPGRHFFHHRHLGTGDSHPFRALLEYGRKDYYLGNHPLWEAMRILYRAAKRPLLLGSLILACGYLGAAVLRVPRAVSAELMTFHRREQMDKLRQILGNILLRRKVERYSTASSAGKTRG